IDESLDQLDRLWKLQDFLVIKQLTEVSCALLGIDFVNNREGLRTPFLALLVHKILLIRDRVAIFRLDEHKVIVLQRSLNTIPAPPPLALWLDHSTARSFDWENKVFPSIHALGCL